MCHCGATLYLCKPRYVGTHGENLKALRRAAGLTQDQVAEHLGIGGPAVSSWERDKSLPDPDRLPMLAELYGVEISDVEPDSNAHAIAALEAEISAARASIDELTVDVHRLIQLVEGLTRRGR